jgi:polysaccharide biosynthesis transport protein
MKDDPSTPPSAPQPERHRQHYPAPGYGYGYGYAGYPVYVDGDGDADSVSPLKIQRFLRFLRAYWWVPVLSTLLLAGAALFYNSWSPPTYTSVAKVWETEKLRLPEGAAFTGDAATYYGTQIELLRSVKMQEMALARLQAGRTNIIPTGDDNKPLRVKLQIVQAPKSSVFAIEASCSSPEYAQSFLNALTAEYVEYRRAIRKLVSGDTLSSISEQVLRLERELKTDQDALTAFEKTNNLAILQEEGTVAAGYLARLKTQKSDLQLEAQLLEATRADQDWASPGQTNAVGILSESVNNQTASSMLAANDRHSARKEVELLKAQRERFSKYLRPKHPKIVKLDNDIQRAQKLLELFQSQGEDQLAAARQAVKLRIENLQTAIKEWEGKVVEANNQLAEVSQLKLNMGRTQALYDRLVLMLQNVDISRNIDQETLAVLEAASPAKRSYKQEATLLALAVFAGLVVGVGLVFFIDLRDDRLTCLSEVTEKVNAEVMGQVPDMRRLGESEDSPIPLLSRNDERHTYAESYRNLRSALVYQQSGDQQHPKVVLVTSAVPNEGKTTVAANLAHALAFGGARVLLVDGDLRKGTLYKLLHFEPGPGLSDLLGDESLQDKVFQTNGLPNLNFMASGKIRGNPGDAFLGQGLQKLIASWREKFDYVLIDSSPVFAADDAPTLAPKVDGVIFVVRGRFSHAKSVKTALELLRQRKATVLGLVYNRARAARKEQYYYTYKSYYQNGNGEQADESMEHAAGSAEEKAES